VQDHDLAVRPVEPGQRGHDRHVVGAQLERRLRPGHLATQPPHRLVVPPAVAQVVQGDGAQPGLGVVEPEEPLLVAQRLREGLLHGILGVRLVAAHGIQVHHQARVGRVEDVRDSCRDVHATHLPLRPIRTEDT
jgi:hypothetical protein